MDKNTTESGKAYTHLSLQEREEIAIGLEIGESRRSIARRLGRDPSAISREIRRNNNTPFRSVKYRATVAQKRADERKKNSHRRKRLANPLLRLRVEHQLKHQHRTPQEIAGRLPQEFPGMKTNYESLYQWIYYDRPDLVQYLVRGHKKRHKRAVSKKSRVGKIPHRVDISQRPLEINSRREAGHWEADTVVSRAGKHAVAVFVERKYRLYLAVKMKDKSAREMCRAAVKALGRLPAVMRKSITYDNGLENALHDKINEALGTKSYFCKPYHSWEKGSIENRNGILRRFFPK